VLTASDTWARWVGLAVGLVLALAAVLSWRIAAEGAAVGAEVRFVAAPPGELTAAPVGAFLAARRLRPGGVANGQLALRNITGAPVSVRMRGLPSVRALDRPLRVEVKDGEEVIFRGRLGGLRSWTRGVVLAKGARRALATRVWLPAGAGRAVAGAIVDVTVELWAEATRG
jgi:hypothetical protein